MDHFIYHNSILHAEKIPITEIASAVGTPFYCYSHATLERHYKVFSEAFASVPTTICFAVKANSNLAVLKTLADLGSGADTVSEGEIRRAIKAGIPPEKIVFSGVGKTRSEMQYALEVDIKQFNVESLEELEILNKVAGKANKKARVAVRVNPDIDAGSHDKISTGRKTDKFGVAWEDVINTYNNAANLEHIEIIGVTCHIGSQLTKLEPFKKAFNKITTLVENLRSEGHDIITLDLGGGLGIPYEREKDSPPTPSEYATMIIDMIEHLGCELILEPGRLIAGNAGILVTEVILVKRTSERTFIVTDAAMNDLLRPAMYGSYHEIVPIIEPKSDAEYLPTDIVGPVCETADRFAKDCPMPPVNEGDLLAFRSSGAYGAVMSNTYNSRLLIPEIMVQNSQFTIIRKRQTYDELLALDNIV